MSYNVNVFREGKWIKIKNVVHRNLDDLATAEQKAVKGYRMGKATFWVFTTEEEETHFIPIEGSVIKLCKGYIEDGLRKMSKDAGQPIQRA